MFGLTGKTCTRAEEPCPVRVACKAVPDWPLAVSVKLAALPHVASNVELQIGRTSNGCRQLLPFVMMPVPALVTWTERLKLEVVV